MSPAPRKVCKCSIIFTKVKVFPNEWLFLGVTKTQTSDPENSDPENSDLRPQKLRPRKLRPLEIKKKTDLNSPQCS